MTMRTRQEQLPPFFPRLVYNSITINLTRPETINVTPAEIGGDTISLGGQQEHLHMRHEYRVVMTFERMDLSVVKLLETYWTNWGSRKKTAQLTLDQTGQAAGWWEYDNYNSFFTLAIWDGGEFRPHVGRLRRQIYDVELAWRQGSAG